MTGAGTVSIRADGVEVHARPGARVLDVLREHGLRVPTLCDDPRLTPYGGCGLCLVERLDGPGGLVAACATAVEHGMVLATVGPRVRDARRRQLALLSWNHVMDCPVCERRSDCRLQDLVHEYGLPDEPPVLDRAALPRDDASPVIVRDAGKCVVCGRCARLCDEVQGVSAIAFADRALGTRIATFDDRPLDCEFCGQCVNACPVGALQARPFPGRVEPWLRSASVTTCSYCSCGCQIVLETGAGSLERVTADPTCVPNHGKLCVKGWLGWDVAEDPERIRKPLIRRDDGLREVSWDEALDFAALRLRACLDRGLPIFGIGSPRMTTEDAYQLQRFLRAVLATPHVDVGPVGGAGALVGGIDRIRGAPRSTADLRDLAGADLVIVFRGDPTRTHPLIKTELVQGVRQRGQRLVLVHSLSGGLERHAGLFLGIRPGSEPVLLRGLAARLLAREPAMAFRCRDLPGFAAWSASLAEYTPEEVATRTGVDVRRMDALAERIEASHRVVCVVVTGLGIPGDEAEVTRAVGSLDALLEHGRGNAGGVLIAGEKCNLQGVIDVGLHPDLLPGHRRVDDTGARRDVEALWRCRLPSEPGLMASRATAALASGTGALYLVGHDPAGGWPLEYDGERAVRRADLVVVHDPFLSRTARLADVVFPVRMLGEREGSLVGLDGVRRLLRPLPSAPEDLPQDGGVLAELARRLGHGLPEGRELRAEMETQVRWPLRTGGAPRFVASPPLAPVPESQERFLLDASPQRWHSGSTTSRSRQLRELAPTLAVRLSPRDAERLRIAAGDPVRLTSESRDMLLHASIDATVRPGTVLVAWHSKGDSAGTLARHNSSPTWVDLRRSS